MTKLILLEDEAILREEVAEYLGDYGYQVAATGDIAGFWQAFARNNYRLAIIDLGLPDGDGMELIADLRRGDRSIGVIVLTARSGSRAAGLDIGADHYLSKPMRLNELLATVNALARRLGADAAQEHWTLDATRRELAAPDGTVTPLSAQDYLVLRALMDGHGRPIDRRRIVAALGEDYLAYDQRRLDTQMRRLRQKVKEHSGHELPVNTVHGVGYQFSAPALIKG